MTLIDATAVVLWLGVTTYAVFGGADFGAGFWDLVSGRGEQAERSRGLIAAAIGPVWEANHTWLIFDLVILWTAFPVAFAAIMSSLFVPLCLAAVGIVLRGAAFAFRPVVGSARGRRVMTAIFAASSVVTPFFLGAAGGGIASGRVSLDPSGGVFLVADARRLDDTELAALFLRRARGAALVTGGLAVAGIFVLMRDAPVLATELTGRGWPLVVAGLVLGGAALVAIGRRAPFGTRPLAVGAVVAVIWGWGVAQYPDILPRTLSLADAAAPSGSLGSLLVVFVAAALAIAPSLALLFWLTQRNRLTGHAPSTVADPAARVD